MERNKYEPEEDYVSLSMKKLDWRLNFIDRELQHEFVDYYKRQKLKRVLLGVNVYYSFFLWPSTVIPMAYAHTMGQWIYTLVSLLFNTAAVVCGWLVYYEHLLPDSFEPWKTTTQSILATSYMLFTVFDATRALFTSCEHINPALRGYLLGWHCTHEITIIPDYILPLLVLIPITAMLSLCEVRLDMMIVLTCVSNLVFMAIAGKYVPDSTYVQTTIIITFAIVFLLIDIHISHIRNFLRYKKLQETLAENKRIQDENRAAELRNMIGNLAHDLKTPLASFMSGIDIMEHSIQQLLGCVNVVKLLNTSQSQKQDTVQLSLIDPIKQQSNLSTTESLDSTTTTVSQLQSHIDTLSLCFKNVRNTNLFMLMMINRCIDYTKASKGLKLTPRNETIDMMETLLMPLQCMKNIQERVSIELEPIDKSICSHIITDKQWLQENILCLLSNAVKYSSDGNVSIRVFLIFRHVNPNDFINKSNTSDLDKMEKNVTSCEDSQAGFQKKAKHTLLSSSMSSSASSSRKRRQTMSDILMFSAQIFASPSKKAKLYPDMENSLSKSSISLPQNNNFDEAYANIPMFERDERDEPTTIYPQSSLSGNDPKDIPQIKQPFVRFEIADHGVGIPEEMMKSLFHPFQKAQRLTGGTGLGLFSLAIRLDALHGYYGVQKRDDGKRGSVFWFEVPYRPDEYCASNSHFDTFKSNNNSYRSALEQTVLNTPIGTSRPGVRFETPISPDITCVLNSPENSNVINPILPPGSSFSPETALGEKPAGWTILIVDDSPTIVKMISMMLRQHQHKVTVAENGEIAVDLLVKQWEEHQTGYDVVLMDLQMPVMDGLEATRRIREYERQHSSRHQLIIGMSANSDHDTMEDALRIGMDDFATKPFRVDAFHQKAMKLRSFMT